MKPNDVTDATFQSEVLQAQELVVVDFWAPWCGPCRMIAPVLEQIGASYNGELKIVKLNVDENPQNAQVYGIRSIPTLILFKNGVIVDKVIGAMPKNQLQARINRALSAEGD
jgi:thioredoxin 1